MKKYCVARNDDGWRLIIAEYIKDHGSYWKSVTEGVVDSWRFIKEKDLSDSPESAISLFILGARNEIAELHRQENIIADDIVEAKRLMSGKDLA